MKNLGHNSKQRKKAAFLVFNQATQSLQLATIKVVKTGAEGAKVVYKFASGATVAAKNAIVDKCFSPGRHLKNRKKEE